MHTVEKLAGWRSRRTRLDGLYGLLLMVAASSLGGCLDPSPSVNEQPFGLGDCPRPDEGCSCEPGTPPLDCFESEGSSCAKGTRHCREGVWTSCLGVEDYEVNPRTGLIAPGFSKCSFAGCHPDCFVAHDSPDPWDIHDGNATEEIFRSTDTSVAPGVYLELPGGEALVDVDGDGIADLAEDPGCVDTVSPSTGVPDSQGNFGCASGDGFGMYAELTPGSSATGSVPVIRPPLPPIDLYLLADLAVVHLVIEVDLAIGVWTLVDARMTLDDVVLDLAANADTFTSSIESVYTDAGQAPDVRYGIGYFHDYQAWNRYGDPGGRAHPYVDHLPFTTDSNALGTSLASLVPTHEARGVGDIGGIGPIFNAADLRLEVDWDWGFIWVRVDRIELLSPESHSQALYSIATGEGLPYGANHAPPGGACPDGTFGYPCFREGAIPVVAVVTDDVMHNGPGGDPPGRYPYDQDFLPLATTSHGGSIKSLPGNGRADNPRQIPGNVETGYRLFDGGNTDNTDRSAGGSGCGSGYQYAARDESLSFNVGTASPIRIRLERTNNWGGDTLIALHGPSGLVGCWSTGGSVNIDRDLAPGSYRLQIDGARKNDGFLGVGNYEHTGRYRIGIGRVPAEWPIGYQSHVVPALQDAGVRVIGLHGCSLGSVFNWFNCSTISQARSQLLTLASATGGTYPNGTGIVPSVRDGGGGAATSALASGVQSLIRGVSQRIEFIPRDDPGTPVDERAFLSSLYLEAPGCSGGSCVPRGDGGLRCTSCNTDDELELNIAVYYDPDDNPAHPPQTNVPQVYELLIDVVAERSLFGTSATPTVLETIPVRIVIPPENTLEPGTYWRTYDATVFDPNLPPGTPLCSIGGVSGLRPDWSELRWAASTPSNASGTSYIEFEVRSADEVGDLASAPAFCFRVPEAAPSSPSCPALPPSGVAAHVDVGARLIAGGATNYRHLLRVDATLHPSPDRMVGPTLHEMRTEYVCTPIE